MPTAFCRTAALPLVVSYHTLPSSFFRRNYQQLRFSVGLLGSQTSEIVPCGLGGIAIARRRVHDKPLTCRTDKDGKPMSVRERVLKFPSSVKMLWKDLLLYQNIRDAAATKRNAWTVQAGHPFSVEEARVASQAMHSRIPWRQREQQRRFLEDLSTVLPVVVLSMVPVVGYIPTFLSVAAPRQLLSRHFHNEYEMFHYNRLAYQQRRAYFPKVREHFLARAPDEARALVSARTHEKDGTTDDAAEEFSSALLPILRSAFIDSRGGKALPALEHFPRTYLEHVALAVGVYQTFPPQVAGWLVWSSPSWWLRRQVRYMAVTVADDDYALSQESLGTPTTLGDDVVATLTDLELADACLMRGLSVDDLTFYDMRARLMNHLHQISSLREQITAGMKKGELEHPEHDEALGLCTLHLAIMRDIGRQKIK